MMKDFWTTPEIGPTLGRLVDFQIDGSFSNWWVVHFVVKGNVTNHHLKVRVSVFQGTDAYISISHPLEPSRKSSSTQKSAGNHQEGARLWTTSRVVQYDLMQGFPHSTHGFQIPHSLASGSKKYELPAGWRLHSCRCPVGSIAASMIWSLIRWYPKHRLVYNIIVHGHPWPSMTIHDQSTYFFIVVTGRLDL